MSKAKKIQLLNDLKSGRINLQDLIKTESLSMDQTFFHGKRREILFDGGSKVITAKEECEKYQKENPGKPVRLITMVRRSE